jgi:putative nucleotide binding protein
MTAEEKALVLDFMPTGKPSAYKTEPLAQVIGKDYFTLLELTPQTGKSFSIAEEVNIGKEGRDKVDIIKGRITYKDLTSNSLAELEGVIRKIVDENKSKFLAFYNTSKGITLKRHQIELLPGMGKKHMLAILDARERKPFESFEDLDSRVKSLPDPVKAIVKRIVEELEGTEDKYYLFVRPPSPPKRDFGNRRFHNDFSRQKSFHGSRNFSNRGFSKPDFSRQK